MEFTNMHGHGGVKVSSVSPDGTMIASASKFRLIIRDSDSLNILHLFSCLDSIQLIEWSSDSQYILCGMLKRGTVQVWSIQQPKWSCKIDEGLAGHARWSPDGRHILTTADFQIRITVWSLVNKSVCYVKSPKLPEKGLAFSRDGKLMAVAERRDCKDFVSVYSCSTWELIKQFRVQTSDLVDLSWSPDSRVICVWDTCLEYKVFLYSPDGRPVEKFQAYEHALGIKSVEWSPTSQFLSIGSYDQKLRVLNHLTWKVLGEFNHSANVTSSAAIYHEVDIPEPLEDQHIKPRTKYAIEEGPVSLPSVKPFPDKPNPKLGVGLHSWSADGKFILSKNDNMASVLWVWNLPKLELHSVLWQKDEIKCAKWDPVHPSRLALCTGSSKIFFWRPEGTSSVDIPGVEGEGDFNVISLEWHPSGNSLILYSKGKLCCCYLPEM